MNKRLEELKEEEANFKGKKKRENKKTFMCILVCVFMAFFAQAYVMFSRSTTKAEDKKASKVEVSVVDKTAWELILVNAKTPLDKEFRVSLEEIPGGKVDTRIKTNLLDMIEAAKADGVTIWVTSAYRSVSKQKTLYEDSVAKYLASGLSEEESKKQAGRYVNPPGASEHHTGLAVDFLTEDLTDLTEEFAKKDAYKWLKKNASSYGFIERYGKDTEKITGVAWEPWHYRYVGTGNAEAMVKKKVTLEEYLEK